MKLEDCNNCGSTEWEKEVEYEGMGEYTEEYYCKNCGKPYQREKIPETDLHNKVINKIRRLEKVDKKQEAKKLLLAFLNFYSEMEDL